MVATMSIRRARAELVLDAGAVHGEGPAWDAASQELLWVDLFGDRLHRMTADGRATSEIFDQHVCVAVPRSGGGLVLALGDGIWLQDPDGARRRVMTLHQPAGTPIRMNDGKCDPAGRFWAGSMADDETTAGAGTMYRMDPDLSTHEMFRDVTISNGLAWTGDGRTMFYIDTPTRRVDRFDIDPATGAIANRRTAVSITSEHGLPDGMTIDDEGGLWVAMWKGSAVHRYTQDGRLDTVVELPCAKVTSCCFGGPKLDELYITTSRYELTDEERAAQPLAGALFRFHPGVTGPAAVAFAG